MITDKNTNQESTTDVNKSQDRRTYIVPEIQSILRIGKTKAYEICDGTRFRVIPIGSAIRVCKDSFDEWYDNHYKKE
jgi:hypothetical protein